MPGGRTYRDVASELAHALNLNYVFGVEFQELSEGTRARPAYHGMATLSPWPLSKPRIIRFRDQSTFWRPRWYVPDLPVFQRRIGGRIALVAEATVYGRKVVTYNLHLESRGPDELRLRQLNEVACRLPQAGRSAGIGGGRRLQPQCGRGLGGKRSGRRRPPRRSAIARPSDLDCARPL